MDFLYDTAIPNELKSRSRTYIKYGNYNDTFQFLGYFSIALKVIDFGDEVSKTAIKKMTGDKDKKNTSGYLIGQFAINDKFRTSKDVMSGKTLLEDCLDQLYEANGIVGGKLIIIECKESEKLIEFYERNGFRYLQKVQTPNNGELVQMIKLL
ncbi:GNAT family protein [Methanococcus maripaludis]|uniref:N-acetyltransferase domain-containing protein n=1 Tax=Methanococcus maripaludis OS7 TaxID=637915 RepID=A0A2Z5PFK3_METMI|nr:GNAT family N-acetyltransferase [Methanococcus maripaludis]BAP62579.1 hypothetical protein MMOS7_04930 [Methanococcus maripaludis OS7]